jgi:hypothetical protein
VERKWNITSKKSRCSEIFGILKNVIKLIELRDNHDCNKTMGCKKTKKTEDSRD